MGRTKHEIEVKRENWKWKAESEGWRCEVCCAIPHFDERDVFFKTGLCPPCNNSISKDD